MRSRNASPATSLVTEPTPVKPRPLAQHLAGRLRELRARRGLTQEQVARRLGCHESAVSRWENGSRFPTGEDLVALADLFAVSTDDLLGRMRQYARSGWVLLDLQLMERLAATPTTEEFDRLIVEQEERAGWLPVPEGAVIVPVSEAVRMARNVVDRHKGTTCGDRLFRSRA